MHKHKKIWWSVVQATSFHRENSTMTNSDQTVAQGLTALRQPCPTRAAIRAALEAGEDIGVIAGLARRPQFTPPINLPIHEQELADAAQDTLDV